MLGYEYKNGRRQKQTHFSDQDCKLPAMKQGFYVVQRTLCQSSVNLLLAVALPVGLHFSVSELSMELWTVWRTIESRVLSQPDARTQVPRSHRRCFAIL